MIAKLKGVLAEKHPNLILINVNNIFFEVNISLNCYSALPTVGNEIELPVITIFREDSVSLYGFSSNEEKKLFTMLNTVSKIGPKLSLSILSTIPVEKLKIAIKTKDINLISSAPGVGKRTAERIILELRDKIEDDILNCLELDKDSSDSDILSALLNLGYKRNDCINAMKKIDPSVKGFEERFREALKLLSNI
ncbi:MAG: Holliday junction branch migration protein RuvA [Deferribacterales bacterium]